MKRKIIIVGVLLILLVALGGTWIAGSILIAPANEAVGSLPADVLGGPVQFPSESGVVIHGWFLAGRKGAGGVVLMHGVRANRLSMLERARFLSRAGYSVLLFDFQAHGESEGKRITFGYLESADARAAVSFLRANAPGEKVGVIGVSMGGAAALLASPPLEADAMVLEMVYPTIDQAVSDRLIVRFGRWSRAFTPLLTWQLRPRLGVSANALRPIDRVGSIHSAKLFIAGSEDQYTTLEEARQMFAAASEPKALWVVSGAKHEDLLRFAGNEYEQRILEFFGPNLKRKAEPVSATPPVTIP
jgi:uncharacterized protein